MQTKKGKKMRVNKQRMVSENKGGEQHLTLQSYALLGSMIWIYMRELGDAARPVVFRSSQAAVIKSFLCRQKFLVL